MHHISVPRGHPCHHPWWQGPRASSEAQLRADWRLTLERRQTKASCMIPAPYISNGMLAARMSPLRRRSSRVNHWDNFPPVGRRRQQVLPGLLSSSLGASLARRQDPNSEILPVRIGFYVRAFIWASVLSRGAGSMWLTTSTPGPLAFRPVPRSYVLYYYEYGSTVCVTRGRSFKDRSRLLPRAIALSHNSPIRLSSIFPSQRGRDARRFGVIGFRASLPSYKRAGCSPIWSRPQY